MAFGERETELALRFLKRLSISCNVKAYRRPGTDVWMYEYMPGTLVLSNELPCDNKSAKRWTNSRTSFISHCSGLNKIWSGHSSSKSGR